MKYDLNLQYCISMQRINRTIENSCVYIFIIAQAGCQTADHIATVESLHMFKVILFHGTMDGVSVQYGDTAVSHGTSRQQRGTEVLCDRVQHCTGVRLVK